MLAERSGRGRVHARARTRVRARVHAHVHDPVRDRHAPLPDANASADSSLGSAAEGAPSQAKADYPLLETRRATRDWQRRTWEPDNEGAGSSSRSERAGQERQEVSV